ncbi:hypothetical protein [Streptomyces sp. RTd22]|uniref:hypothetical protein n=1 Tax=Streptomyces sp. RTd22 TaxID=1841249 RepID=UPI0007C498EA|nr:hypothetical protein [Streptomyces sp. RTd22]
MTSSQPAPLPWAPPRGDDVEVVRVGPYWDVLRAPIDIGERALTLLGDATGAVIADYGLMYWLIPSGHAQHWRRLRSEIRALGAHRAEITYVGVPPATHTTGPRLHWRIPVGPDRYLTDAGQPRKALTQAIATEPAEEATTR